MAETGRRYNPKEKKPNNTGKKKMDKVLNLLIGIVVVLILIVAGFIVIGGSNDKNPKNDKKIATSQLENEKNDNIIEKDAKEKEKEKAKQAQEANEEDQTEAENNSEKSQNVDNTTEENDEQATETKTKTETESDSSSSDNATNNAYNYEESKTATTETSDDPNVTKVITDSEWKPTKTSQQETGDVHNSSYSKGSIDWNEKITTIANTTGLDEKDMIIWYVKNGGGPDTSIGIVSSNDKEKSYRVSIKWVPNEGWKPTKLEVLKTYKGAY